MSMTMSESAKTFVVRDIQCNKVISLNVICTLLQLVIFIVFIYSLSPQPSIQKQTKIFMHQVTTTHDMWLKGLFIDLYIFLD